MIRLLRKEVLVWLAVLFFILILPDIAQAGEWGTFAFRIVGTVIGSYFGGPMGGMAGGMIGGAIGGLIFGGEEGPKIKGPRLQDKTVQSAAPGEHITKTWGMDRVSAQLIFSSPLKERKIETETGGKGGFGGGGATMVTYKYSVDLMLSFGRRAKGIRRLWAGPKLIIDNTGTTDLKKKWRKLGKRFTVRDGNETQLPSALEESYHGVGQCSAHRGLFCLEAEDFDLTNFGNVIPGFTAEIYTEGDETFGRIDSYTPPTAPYSWWVHSFGYVDNNGEIWAMYYPFSTQWPYPGYAHIFHWTLATPDDPVTEYHALWDGEVTQIASIAGYIRVRSDEPAAAAFGSNVNSVALSYFRLEDGTRLDINSSEVSNKSRPEILVKYDDELYVFFQNGTPAGYLIKFNANTGIKMVESDVINVELSTNAITDMARSESYLWVLYDGRLAKIDPDTLTLESDIAITGTTGRVLAMAVISDSEIRLVTAITSGTRFYIVDPATGVATLDQHDPHTTYAAIRGFGKWGLHYNGGLYIVDFGGYIGGFGARIDFFGTSTPDEGIPLWKIVRDINIMAGLDSVIDSAPPDVGDINVDDLEDIVHGYSITRSMSARDAISQLMLCYFFDCRESDLTLEYPKRGKAPVKSIPGSDLAVRSAITDTLPDRLTHTRMRETECPLRVHVIYNNWEAAYQSGHEYAPRLITDARQAITLQIAVALTSVEARQIAETNLAELWLARETFTARASRKHIRIDPADNVEVVITET